MADDKNTVVMEDMKLIFRNFKGDEQRFNQKGDRNFCVLLEDEVAHAMAEDGWNVKWLTPREGADEGETDQAYLQVKIKYDGGKPPRIVIITSRGKSNLDESQVEMLDWADILTADLIVRPYHWDVQGKTGISAYLQSMYVTIEEDELEKKYAGMDEQ